MREKAIQAVRMEPAAGHARRRGTATAALGLVLVASLIAPAAHGATTGFANRDLSQVEHEAQRVGGKRFETRASADRLTLACTDCDGSVAIDLLIGTSTDGTEGRFRSGETSLEKLEALCRARDDACRLERLDIGGAVGWLSVYSRGSTAVLFRDGDMLTVRALAGTPLAAKGFVRAALDGLALRIVGR